MAAACDDEADAAAFQEPMTAAWSYYVSGGQFLVELRGLTPNYPMGADVLSDAVRRVRSDPGSNRSWNMAWLCLVKIRDEYVDFYFLSSFLFSHPYMLSCIRLRYPPC